MTTFRFEYRPLPVFVGFHESRAYERAVIGGYGSGKSHAAVAEVIGLGLEQPGSEILVCRKTVPALRDTTEAIFVNMLPPEFFKACDVRRMGGHLESVVFPNGTKYYFRGLDDWRKLRSMNLAYILYDEADEIDEEAYIGMMSRVRQTRPTAAAKALGATSVDRRGIVLACNPQGHNWIWKRFVSDQAAPNTRWFKSSSLDNPFLPREYIDSLLAMPKPWVQRYVLCGFDDFAGQIYTEWTWDTHVVPMPSGFDPTSFIWMGMDPGTHDPTAGVWAYYDKQKHRLVAVAEYQEAGLAASKHASAWRSIEAPFGRCRVTRRIADPTVNTRDRGSNMALADQYRRFGFNFELGPRVVAERLPMLGQLIHEGRFVCTANTPQLFERLREYKWQDLTPAQREKGSEPAPLKKDTHLVEAAQYIASRYITAPPVVATGDAPEDPRAEFAAEVNRAIRKQMLARQSATGDHDLGTLSL